MPQQSTVQSYQGTNQRVPGYRQGTDNSRNLTGVSRLLGRLAPGCGRQLS